MSIKIFEELERGSVEYLDHYIPFPKAYRGTGHIKAIVLGADPSNHSDLMSTKRLDYVFDLAKDDGGKTDGRYFTGIMANLKAIGLHKENIYVQNVCRNYFTRETYKQQGNWLKAAAVWAKYLKEELDAEIDPDVPVLATSEIIMKALLTDPSLLRKPAEYYSNPSLVPVKKEFSMMSRNMIPFYRHNKYYIESWKLYQSMLFDLNLVR